LSIEDFRDAFCVAGCLGVPLDAPVETVPIVYSYNRFNPALFLFGNRTTVQCEPPFNRTLEMLFLLAFRNRLPTDFTEKTGAMWT